MSIYLKIKGIEGDVKTKGLEKTIHCTSIHYHARRSVNTSLGQANTRTISQPQFGEIYLTKQPDLSTIGIMQSFLQGNVIEEVKILYATTGAMPHIYSELTLNNVVITSYREAFNIHEDAPQENIVLNYTKIARKHLSSDPSSKLGSPKVTGFDLNNVTVL